MFGFAVLTACAWPGTAPAEYKATLKLACTQNMDHPYMAGAKKFADLIRERTRGRITVKLYPSNQLGKGEREMTEGIQQGAIDLLVTSTGPLGGFSPSINILDFPFLFRDFHHVDLVLDGAIGQRLLGDFEKAGIKALAFWENGFRNLTNSRGPVRDVADGKGLKIRTMENKVHLTAWKAAGFNHDLFRRIVTCPSNPLRLASWRLRAGWGDRTPSNGPRIRKTHADCVPRRAI